MNTLPLTFAVNEFTTAPWSFEEDLRACRDLGVEQLELCEAKLADDRLDEQLAMLRDTGLRVCSVQPRVRTAVASASQPQPRTLAERIERYRESLRRLAPHTPGAVFVTNTGPAPGGDLERGLREAVEFHRALLPMAADLGVRLAIEPLNPVFLNAETCLWTFGQAVDFVETVGSPDLGICVDTWNLWQDPLLQDGLRAHGDLVFLVQVSGWRTPRSGMDRRSVGTGPIPTGALLRTVVEVGYDGPCVLEILSHSIPDSLYDTDLARLIMDNRDALGRAWRAASRAPGARLAPAR